MENLMRTELLEVSMWRDEELTRPFGIFDDAPLPAPDPGLRSQVRQDEVDKQSGVVGSVTHVDDGV